MTAISLTIKNACEASGLGPTKLYALIKERKIEARKEGRRTLILADSLRRHIEGLPSVVEG
ncbi:helix-turn-helix domain-containing protein [Mesorhizobium sp.]|uniref:helix-turn-helix domain-containing protein n=1 Tax=Mesorhizobium sp. TaxID=1871066 RepID=UPI000FE5F5CB|nr:helix-turn-helix domain-containing protein [Mesorhizobium sp.]RWK12184.1 MAG: DNA-binding protein [Mesorhizobium sp.]